MRNFVLLTGAGFSKNWGGLTAREITNHLMSRVQNIPDLREALNRGNFEDVLSQVQSQYLAAKTPQNEGLVSAIQEALAGVFGDMNAQFAARQFEFSNDIAHSIQRFLVRFDAIFTLNQDLLIELHYSNQNAAIWHGTRWQGYELPGLRELPSEDAVAGRVRSKWVPQDQFRQTPNMQPYFKLHGSTAWRAQDGSSFMVMGRNKVGLIRSNAILRWNYEKFEEYLARPDTRLMVIGYGFADDHINAIIVEAFCRSRLGLMYIVHPSGKSILDRSPNAAIRVPQPIMEIPSVECTVPLSAAFSTDYLAQSLLEGIFGRSKAAK